MRSRVASTPAWQDDSTLSIEVNLLNPKPMKRAIKVKEFNFRTPMVMSSTREIKNFAFFTRVNYGYILEYF